MVMIATIEDKQYDFSCGGTLVRAKLNILKNIPIFYFQINKQFVLTAAHCFCDNGMCKREMRVVRKEANTIKVRLQYETSWSFCNDMVVYLCFVSLADTNK